jgi:hypothetical protein
MVQYSKVLYTLRNARIKTRRYNCDKEYANLQKHEIHVLTMHINNEVEGGVLERYPKFLMMMILRGYY